MPRLSREGGNPTLAIESGASYEFLMSLATISEVDNHSIAEVGPQWLAATRERAGEALMRRLEDFTQGNGDFFVHLVPLAYDAPARTVTSLLAHLATVDARDMLLLIVGYHDYHMRRTIAPEMIRAAVEGDRGAARKVIDSCESYPDWQAFVTHLFAQSPEQVKQELLAILEMWHERVWLAEERRVVPIVERDAEAKRALALDLPFDRFVEVATNGVHFVPHAGVDRLVLVPSWVNRPWVSYAEYGGAMFLVYPVADESLSGEDDAPPLRLIRLTKALGDEKRLRILRALAQGPRSLVELSELLDVPKTTMHHHMVTLRSAGLVSVGAGSKDYRLRADVLPNLAQMLGGYLSQPAEPGEASERAGEAPGRGPLPATIGRSRRPGPTLTGSTRRSKRGA
jgi:DNA-binding transcriptional ArsR family regulator